MLEALGLNDAAGVSAIGAALSGIGLIALPVARCRIADRHYRHIRWLHKNQLADAEKIVELSRLVVDNEAVASTLEPTTRRRQPRPPSLRGTAATPTAE